MMQTEALPNTGATRETNGTMKCLVKEDLNKEGFSLRENQDQPKPGFGEVKIRVLATAVCGTDKSIYNSTKSEGIRREMQRYLPQGDNYRPIVVGHEFCGIVEELGPGVEAMANDVPKHLLIEAGDYVTAEMHLSCGHCALCRTGNEHICISAKVKGVHQDGCFAQSVVVPYKNVILLGKDGDTSQIPPRIGAMLDAFGNAVHTVAEADVAGKSVAILGAGPLGLMSTFLCRAFGATRIYVTEAADLERREKLANEFHADHFIDVSKGSAKLHELIGKLESNSNGVDVVLEMSGSLPAYQDAFKIVRNGGKVILLGIAREPLPQFDIANGVIWKGVTVKGIFGRKMFSTWETMLSLIRSDRLDLKSKLEKVVAQKFYKLEEYKEAFDVLSTGEELKVIFSPDGSLCK
ncbi:MAG: alcohol dehydrogenase catalytic domain-containing protein [Candidatus Obscuribacterales bacterium]|nr:alcohol dehydrogenase catalytic domain-containing protein [Candidatus Obscuribacterales bacterium]